MPINKEALRLDLYDLACQAYHTSKKHGGIFIGLTKADMYDIAIASAWLEDMNSVDAVYDPNNLSDEVDIIFDGLMEEIK